MNIAEAVAQAIYGLYGAQLPTGDITVQETRKEFTGHETVIAFPFAKYSKKTLPETAAEIGDFVKANNPEVAGYNVIKGFLNFEYTPAFVTGKLRAFNPATPVSGKRIMVEFSSPNTNKPLHLGHIRNILLGHAMVRILQEAGNDVIAANLVNDRGIHICKSMLAWQLFANGETPESAGIKGDKLVGKYYVAFDAANKKQVAEMVAFGESEDVAARNTPLLRQAQNMLQSWEAGNKDVIDLWRRMNSWVYAGFDETYKQLGVSFDKIYYESDTYLLGKDIVEYGLGKNVFYKKADGSVWVDLTEDGLDEKLVLRADGTSVYITQDLGTAVKKHDDFNTGQSIYVVGNEQDYHFKVLFLILKKLGYEWAPGLYHLSYGMVDLPTGKMKSREGTVVDADDLIAEMVNAARERTQELGKSEHATENEKEKLYHQIGMGALKYFLLKVDPKKRILFNPEESIDFQGNTGPFIQYTYARINSLLLKAGSQSGITESDLTPIEEELILTLERYKPVVAEAAKMHSPATVANYVYEVAKLFNKFYHELPAILKLENEGVKARRVKIAEVTALVIEKCMYMLGIEVPDRM